MKWRNRRMKQHPVSINRDSTGFVVKEIVVDSLLELCERGVKGLRGMTVMDSTWGF